ncbi:MAG: metal ABC transporter permease [Pseudomonadota bacterium]
MNFDVFDWRILAPALAAGLIVLSTHVPFGREVLRRGIIFADLAVAQVAGLGVMAAAAFGWSPHGLGAQTLAIAGALSAAGFLHLAERRWPEVQEALIGVLFVLAACAGILLVAHLPHGGEHLQNLLIGQILFVTPNMLLTTALVSAVVLALWFGGWRKRSGFFFYGLFAIAVTLAVQLVGVYLVFASLIIPALAARRLNEKSGLGLGYALGIAGYLLGILVSVLFDLTTGAVVVLMLALTGGLLALIPQRLFRRRRRPTSLNTSRSSSSPRTRRTGTGRVLP